MRILFLLLILGSCTSKNFELPLPKDDVVNIVADMRVAEMAAKVYREKDERDSMLLVFSQQVYEIHSIDSGTYNQILEVFENDLEQFYKIENEVHQKLSGLLEKETEIKK